MKNLVKVVKITRYEGKTESIVGLGRGDNLEVDGNREVVDYLECHRGLHSITTIKVDSGLKDLYIKHRYLATAEMLQQGELISVARTNFNDFNVLDSEIEFYKRNLVRRTAEAVA